MNSQHEFAKSRLRRQICSDSSKQFPTSYEFNTHRRLDSTRQLSRVGVKGVYWLKEISNALTLNT